MTRTPTDLLFRPKRLTFWRVYNGLSMSELARKSGVDLATISRTERGVSIPRPATIKRLAKTLDIPFTELVEIE